nr:immunoglobulin heavy chain junction region [Macaca mulatta]MOW32339.1 immunoglobulin heavy chain junction region [Macaca mulatta]MOW32380.1 immunoglobulin heavy chain junction region [Macaca mulatta]MOW32412.1 immunoglobulin heavy chain junction region [Macaca mulatta]MOW32642.1 immunoglobulin heavy chain junction region [Macaca mulatta]
CAKASSSAVYWSIDIW